MAAAISSYKPLKHITQLYNIYQQGIAAAERVFSFLDAPEAPDTRSHSRRPISVTMFRRSSGSSRGHCRFPSIRRYLRKIFHCP